jgi:hypothetical protein
MRASAWDAYLPLPFSAANLHFEDPVHEAQHASGALSCRNRGALCWRRARGLASAWTQIHIQFEEEVAAVLGINHAEVQQAALIAVAYPRREDFKPAYREPIQNFTHWDSW